MEQGEEEGGQEIARDIPDVPYAIRTGSKLLVKAWMRDGCPKDVHFIRDGKGDRIAYQNLLKGHYVAARGYWLHDSIASTHQRLLDLAWRNNKELRIYFEDIDDFRIIDPFEAETLLRMKKNRNRRRGEIMVHFYKHKTRPEIPAKTFKRLEDFGSG